MRCFTSKQRILKAGNAEERDLKHISYFRSNFLFFLRRISAWKDFQVLANSTPLIALRLMWNRHRLNLQHPSQVLRVIRNLEHLRKTSWNHSRKRDEPILKINYCDFFYGNQNEICSEREECLPKVKIGSIHKEMLPRHFQTFRK